MLIYLIGYISSPVSKRSDFQKCQHASLNGLINFSAHLPGRSVSKQLASLSPPVSWLFHPFRLSFEHEDPRTIQLVFESI